MAETLYLLPRNTAGAAENMAVDWLMLEEFPEPAAARLRFYGWSRPAFTFGYGQRWAEVQAANKTTAEFIRRPTGGGLVNHRQDWTYALVIPAEHPLAQVRACESYKQVHEALAAALDEAGTPCQLQLTECKANPLRLSVCFEKPEQFDIIRKDDGRKVAGAAQKRTKKGMLLQGSVERATAAEIKDWNAIGENFAQKLAAVLKSTLKKWAGPTWPPNTFAETTAQFAFVEWNEKR